MSTMWDAMTNCNPKGIITSKETKNSEIYKIAIEQSGF